MRDDGDDDRRRPATTTDNDDDGDDEDDDDNDDDPSVHAHSAAGNHACIKQRSGSRLGAPGRPRLR